MGCIPLSTFMGCVCEQSLDGDYQRDELEVDGDVVMGCLGGIHLGMG